MPHSPLLLPPHQALPLSQPLLLPVLLLLLLQPLLQQRGARVSPLLLRGLLLQRDLLGMLYCLLGLLCSLMGCLSPSLLSPLLGMLPLLLLQGLLLLSGTPGGQTERGRERMRKGVE